MEPTYKDFLTIDEYCKYLLSKIDEYLKELSLKKHDNKI